MGVSPLWLKDSSNMRFCELRTWLWLSSVAPLNCLMAGFDPKAPAFGAAFSECGQERILRSLSPRTITSFSLRRFDQIVNCRVVTFRIAVP